MQSRLFHAVVAAGIAFGAVAAACDANTEESAPGPKGEGGRLLIVAAEEPPTEHAAPDAGELDAAADDTRDAGDAGDAADGHADAADVEGGWPTTK